MTPADRQRAFDRAVAAVVRERTRLMRSTRDELVALLKAADRLAREILASQPAESETWSLPRLSAEIRQAMTRFGEQGGARVTAAADEAWRLGEQLVERPIAAAVPEAQLSAGVARLNPAQLVAMRVFLVDRIKDIGVQSADPIGGLATNAERVSVRNNIVANAGTNMASGMDIRGTNGGLSTPSKDVWAYNNAFHTTQGSGSFAGIIVDTDVDTGIAVKNTLVYSPNITATAISDSGSKAAKSNNTAEGTGAGSVKTNPFATTPSSSDLTTYRPSTSAYAYNGGTAIYPATSDDFFNCLDKTGVVRMGAVVPFENRFCRPAYAPIRQ